MKKSSLPKPKYSLDDHVIFTVPSDGNYAPRRDIGKVCSVNIKVMKSGNQISYEFENEDGFFDESSVIRRAIK